MAQTVSVPLGSGTGNGIYIQTVDRSTTDATPGPFPSAAMMPSAVDQGQAYYWRYAWQTGETESREELARGEGRTFKGAEEAIQWLLGDDD